MFFLIIYIKSIIFHYIKSYIFMKNKFTLQRLGQNISKGREKRGGIDSIKFDDLPDLGC